MTAEKKTDLQDLIHENMMRAYEKGERAAEERIIALLNQDICPDWTVDCCDGACSAYNDAINLIKGEQK